MDPVVSALLVFRIVIYFNIGQGTYMGLFQYSLISSKRYRLVIIWILAVLVNSTPVSAANWLIDPEITFKEVYTDNVALTPSGMEDSDLITTISPAVKFHALSPRLKFDLEYTLEKVIYADKSDANDQFHLLNVDSNTEIYDNHLFLDFSLKFSPQNISTEGGNPALDNLSVSDNRSDVLSYVITPFWQQRVGNYANLDLRYKRDQIKSDATTDTDSDRISINVSSGSRFTRYLWDLDYYDEEINSDTGTSGTSFKNLTGQLRYLITRKLALKTSVGFDKNEFASNETDIDGLLWNIGAEWNPSTRTSIEATIGERFFGNDLFFEISHRTRRSKWKASFSQVPDTTRTTLFEQQVFLLTDNFGDPIIDPVTGEPASLNVNVPEQTTEVMIRSRFKGDFQYKLRKNTIDLSFYHDEREFQLSGDTETSLRSNAVWTWNIGPRMSSVLNLAWSNFDTRDGREDKYITGEYKLTRLLGPEIEASIGARYVKKDSNVPENEYDENRIFASIYKTF